MPRPAANAPCPCGSARIAKKCCLPVLQGEPATSPEALMRSRYTAYAVGAVGHLQRTTDPRGPHARADARAWADELRAYCAAVRLKGLTVHEAHEDGDHGEVRFFAQISAGAEDLSFGERSRFRREGGRWLYVDGEREGG